MTGIVGVKFKVMPSSPEVNLEDIKQKCREVIESHGGKNKDYEEVPIAFGLKAVIVFFHFNDEKELDPIEKDLNDLEAVQSVQMIDIRKIA